MNAQIFRDMRLALRSMTREKAFTLAALVSLTLGIGANTALFSVVHGVLMRPLPYGDADRILRVSEFHQGATSAVTGGLLTNFTYHAWKDGKTIEAIGGFRSQRLTDTSGPEPAKIPGSAMTPSVFSILGVRPALGRFFVEADAVENAPAVAVLSHGLWRERFGGDPNVLGRGLILDGAPHTVVGVAPEGFYFPDRETRIFTTYTVSPGSADPARQSVAFFGALAKLRPGVTPEQAAQEGSLIARAQQRPPVVDAVFGKGGPVTVRAVRWVDHVTERVRPALMVFGMGAVFILLIACFNVASLQLTRGVSRQRELAVRASLGASRGRLLAQMMAESLVLVAAGGLLGVALARGLVALLPSFAPRNFPRIDDITVDSLSISFAVGVSVLAGLLGGLLPAIRASRVAPSPALRDGAGASASVAAQKTRASLVAIEAALAVVLLVGAGLLFRSFEALLNVDPGYDTGDVLLARIEPGAAAAREGEAESDAPERMVERARALPGVLFAGAANMAPFDPSTAVRSFTIRSEKAPGGEIAARATVYVVSPGFAEALSLRVKEGRLLSASDLGAGIRPLVVNEEFARLYLSDGLGTVGRRIPGLVNDQPEALTEVVGVVQNLLKNGLDQKPVPEMFSLAPPGRLTGWYHLAIRTKGDPAALAPLVRALARDVDPGSTIETATLASRLEASVAQPRFAAWTVGAFALLALVLAAAGLYGTLSYSVSQRTREIGVRTALGATRRHIVGLILRQGLAVAAAGLALGVFASMSLSKLLEKMLFGVTPRDPVAFLVAPCLLLLAACLACLVPAWRGAAVEPTEALRCE